MWDRIFGGRIAWILGCYEHRYSGAPIKMEDGVHDAEA